MNPATLIGDLWAAAPIPWTIAAATLAVVALALLVLGVVRLVRGARAASSHWKLRVGTTVVQAGVTWAVVTGTYAFCEGVLDLPGWEAAAFAVFLEAATWVTVGMIIAHGRALTDDGRPTTGLGPAGPFFWLFSLLGGTLATMGGTTPGAMVGRAVIVIFGTSLWYLTLLTYTRPDGTPSRFRWTPRRLLVAIGALEPADQDVVDQHEEWQVRRLARAMRWANSRQPLAWFGRRALISRAEQTSEAVIEAARRRYAAAHLLVKTISPDSDVMLRVLSTVQVDPARAAADAAEASEQRRTEQLAEERRREEITLQREREAREHEVELARIAAGAEAAKARAEAEVRRPAARPAPAAPAAPVRDVDPDWQATYDAIPGDTKTEKARNWIRAAWAEGREPTGPEVDDALGAKTLGRQQIRWLKDHGELPPSERSPERPPLSLASTGGG